jgi:hypothetical protein
MTPSHLETLFGHLDEEPCLVGSTSAGGTDHVGVWHPQVMANPPHDPDDLPTSEDWARMVGSQRRDQYTPMGEIFMMGDFASGVRRAHGLKRWASMAVALLILGLFLVAGVASIVNLFSN